MSKPPLPDEVVTMLARPNPAVVATVRADGQPVSTATWYLWHDGAVLLNMDGARKRLEHIRNDPRITLTVLDGERWYTHVSLIGRVTELRADDGMTDIDRIARHYTGSAYPRRDRGRVSAWMTVDTWHAWGDLKDNSQVG